MKGCISRKTRTGYQKGDRVALSCPLPAWEKGPTGQKRKVTTEISNRMQKGVAHIL